MQTGASYGEVWLPERRQSRPSSRFEIDEHLGNTRGSNFEQGERFDPVLASGRVRDAGGSMDADARTRASHFDGQGVHGIDPAFLLDVARALIEAVRQRSYAQSGV